MQDNRKFKIGEEVYIFKRNQHDWFLNSLRDDSFIKGTIIGVENVDYGYHGSGDWILVYKVKCEDGKIYQGDYHRGYKECTLFTKEDIINELKRLISGGIYQLEKIRKQVETNNEEYQMLIDKYNELGDNKENQYKKVKK